MKRRFLLLTQSVALLFFTVSIVRGAEFLWEQEKLNLELHLEQRLNTTLSKMMAPGAFTAVVTVIPTDEVLVTSSKRDKPSDLNIETLLLPGVPLRKTLGNETPAVNRLIDQLSPGSVTFRKFVKNLKVTLVIKNSVPINVVKEVERLTSTVLTLDPNRGDAIIIQQLAESPPTAQTPPSPASPAASPSRSPEIFFFVTRLTLILVLALFLFWPVRIALIKFSNSFPQKTGRPSPSDPLMQKLIDLSLISKASNPRQPTASVETSSREKAGPAFALPEVSGRVAPGFFPASARAAAKSYSTQGSLPFSFISQAHLPNLQHIVSKEDPAKTAIILSYLPVEWCAQIFSQIPTELQTQVAAELAHTHQVSPETVQAIEQELMNRIDFIIGGIDRLVALYESMDPRSQERMIEALKRTKPELALDIQRQTSQKAQS